MGTTLFRFVTIHAFEKQKDRHTERPCNTVRCIICSRTVKSIHDNSNYFIIVFSYNGRSTTEYEYYTCILL